ncbi:MAG: enoyl-CoA hydratase/isomerase family protein [bacterium]
MAKIEYNLTDGNQVAQIILNAPKANVLDREMMAALLAAFDECKTNRALKLITFEGAGDHFSYGASVEEHKKENAAAMLKTFHQLFYELVELSIPTLAKISGLCLGGALELALMCNFLFADESAKLGQPEIVLGVFPPPASLLLPLKIGQARAEELLITGKTISAREAKALRLVNEVYSDKVSLHEGVNRFCEEQILPKSASSLRFAVKAARSQFNEVILSQLPQLERLYLEELMETKDANEGILAFLEKRKPEWQME